MTDSHAPVPRNRSLTRLLLRLFFTRELVTLLSLPMAVYVDALLLDLDRTQDWRAVGLSLAFTYVCSGLLLSLLVMHWLLHRALRTVPDEAPGRRLERLLALPWKLILLSNLLMWMLGGFLINSSIAFMTGKDAWSLVPQGMAVATGVGLLNGSLLFILYERMLMPFMLEEFQRFPRSLPAAGSLFRPRQSWFLPYVLASLLFGTLVFSGTVVKVQLTRLEEKLQGELIQGGRVDLARQLARSSEALASNLLLSVGGTTALLLLGSALTVWWMGRRQREGAEAIYTSLEGLTRGTLQPPRWVSTDEMGDLSASVWLLLGRLQELPRELQAATRRLGEASSSLGEAGGVQEQTLERQSAALHETSTTAEEIRQLSLLARTRVQALLTVSARSAELGRKGETSIQQSLEWLDSIDKTTEHVRTHVSELEQHARELDRVVMTVKDLANRSNMLALNAAIIAANMGEQGRPFKKVAHEFRDMADKSFKATHQVNTILQRLKDAIHDAVSRVEQGSQGVTQAVTQLNASSAPLHELALLAQRGSTMMQEVTRASDQQHLGINQLFDAIRDMLNLTDETLAHLKVVRQAADACDEVSDQVETIAQRYVLEEVPLKPSRAGQPRDKLR